jgi:hypothetical protein
MLAGGHSLRLADSFRRTYWMAFTSCSHYIGTTVLSDNHIRAWR